MWSGPGTPNRAKISRQAASSLLSSGEKTEARMVRNATQQPKAQMSMPWWSRFKPKSSSGARTAMCVRRMKAPAWGCSPSGGHRMAVSKPLTTSRSPRATRMLAGLKFRCSTPRECRKSTAKTNCQAMDRTASGPISLVLTYDTRSWLACSATMCRRWQRLAASRGVSTSATAMMCGMGPEAARSLRMATSRTPCSGKPSCHEWLLTCFSHLRWPARSRATQTLP
mmetsp:Transcript_167109/g.536709  ORF Transcript_167109/g.536709 Transcript_167109/m.536709 type:complete len:225 (+) Transcript_167109:1505-2179(+)